MGNSGNDIQMESPSARLPSGQRYRLFYDNRLKVRVVDRNGVPQAGVGYTLRVGDEERQGQADERGWIIASGVNAGDVTIFLEDGRVLKILEEDEELSNQDETEDQTEDIDPNELEEYAAPTIRPEIFSEEELLEEFFDILDTEDEEDEEDEDDW